MAKPYLVDGVLHVAGKPMSDIGRASYEAGQASKAADKKAASIKNEALQKKVASKPVVKKAPPKPRKRSNAEKTLDTLLADRKSRQGLNPIEHGIRKAFKG